MTLTAALVIHAVAAPMIFGLLAIQYYRKTRVLTPVSTATLFLGVVEGLDCFLVAMVILKSFDMFKSFTGTWLPLMLIFLSSYILGRK
jgi:hypothetical protein